MGRTLLAALRNQTPVPYSAPGRRAPLGLLGGGLSGARAQLRAMGSVGTLFAIVHRTSTSTSAVAWHLYRKAKSGLKADRTEVTSHAALDLWTRPNAFFTRQELVEVSEQHIDLTGEGWLVIARHPASRIPLELWPVRPDRIEPVPDPEAFLAGYIYTGPSGERVPLGLDEVIQIRMPNPEDPYRGMGPVQTILADLDATRYSAEWNRNFFRNSAEPGGIIEVPNSLSDAEFDELRTRWNDQHRGVTNAHRVAILERGKWVDRKFSQRDMQFAELRGVSSTVIREAFGIPKFAVGDVEDVNRATAEASKAWFAEQLTVPRLERFKQALNNDLLPLYGPTTRDLEFDYDSPVPADRDAEARELTAKVTAAQVLIASGLYGPDVLDTLGLPQMTFGDPDHPADPDRDLLVKIVTGAPSTAPLILPLLGFDIPTGALPPTPKAHVTDPFRAAATRLLRAEADDATLDAVQQDHQAALDSLDTQWAADVEPGWIDDVAQQVEDAVDGDDPATALAAMTLDSDQAAIILRRALGAMAQTAADRMAEEAAAQGVDVTAPTVDPKVTNRMLPQIRNVFGSGLIDIAVATAALIGSGLVQNAAGEALRRLRPGVTGREVADHVRAFLTNLPGLGRRDRLSGALHRATNTGRLATLAEAPAATYRASEHNDSRRCDPCAQIDGTEFADLAAANAAYGTGGYVDCLGGARCRGTVVAEWDQGDNA